MTNWPNLILTLGIFGICAVSTFFLLALWGYINGKLDKRK